MNDRDKERLRLVAEAQEGIADADVHTKALVKEVEVLRSRINRLVSQRKILDMIEGQPDERLTEAVEHLPRDKLVEMLAVVLHNLRWTGQMHLMVTSLRHQAHRREEEIRKNHKAFRRKAARYRKLLREYKELREKHEQCTCG